MGKGCSLFAALCMQRIREATSEVGGIHFLQPFPDQDKIAPCRNREVWVLYEKLLEEAPSKIPAYNPATPFSSPHDLE